MVLIKKSVLPIMERKASFYVRAQVKLAAEMSIIKEYPGGMGWYRLLPTVGRMAPLVLIHQDRRQVSACLVPNECRRCADGDFELSKSAPD